MGGKHKQAHRVKNNARPSNSGRSAELLGTTINPFAAFSTAKDSSYVPGGLAFSSTSFDDFDSTLDVKFQLVLKKMNKKDGTTKLKALQEFTELVKTSEPDAVKAVLSFWPRIYACLVVDVEHRVREAVHFAHHAVVTKVKRNLAPYLKQLAGPWFTSQYDTYPPAASAATASFEVAFPPNKVQEAIAFCQDEILQYICDNICDQTPESLSQAKKLSPEESEAKYERVLISSLQGYTLYLNKMSQEHLQAAKEINNQIVSNSKFWKLVKVKVPLIRAAWFGCITALLQNAPFLLEHEAHNAISAVFSNLDESEPTVLPATWEAVLLIITNISEWWKYVKIEKALLPKLWNVLREGGQGNATVIYPNLLPLVSQFPIDINSSNFYSNLFSSMQQGMKKHSVIQSRSEFTAIITSFVECLRYIVMKNVSNVSECETLITAQLIPAIEWTIVNKNNVSKYLFNELAALLHYWYRNIETREYINKYSNYKLFTKCFWDNLEKSFNLSLNMHKQNTETMVYIVNKQVELLLCLKRKNVCKKKEVKVKFVTSEMKVEDNSSATTTKDVDSVDVYMKDLNELAYKTIFLYLNQIKNDNSEELISTLLIPIQQFESYDLFKYLSQQLNGLDKPINIMDVYSNLETILTKEYSCLEPVIDIVFVLYKYLNQDDKNKVLESLTVAPVSECIFWAAKRAIHHPYCNDEIVQKWLSSEKVTELLVSITSSLLTNEITSEQMLFLKQALNQNSNGDILISQDGCMKIIAILSDALLSPQEYPNTIEKCASFAAHLSSILYNESIVLSHGDQLVLALFSLSCNNNFDKDTITSDTLWEVTTAWQDVIYLLNNEEEEQMKPELQNLIWKFIKIIQNNFMSQSNMADIDYLKTVIVDLIQAVLSKNNKPKTIAFMINSVLVLPQPIRSNISQLDDLCIAAELIHGEISWFAKCPVSVDILDKTVENVELLRYLMWFQLVIRVLSEFFAKNITDEDEDEESNSGNEKFVLQTSTDDIDSVIISSFYCYSSVRCFAENYKNTKLFNQILSHLEEMKISCQHFIRSVLVPRNMYEDIFKKIKNDINDLMFAKYFFILITDLFPESNSTNIYKILVKSKNKHLSDINCIQFTQLFADSLSYDNVIEASNRLERFIITRAIIKSTENEVQIAEALSILMTIREKEESIFLYNRNISSVSWEETQTVVEIMRLLTAIINNKYKNLSLQHWDLIIISLAAWANSVEKSKQNYSKISVALFTSAFFDLHCAFHTFISYKELVDSLAHVNTGFIKEYLDIFAQDVHLSTISTWQYIAERELSQTVTLKKLPLLEKIGSVIFNLDSKYLINAINPKLPTWQKYVALSCELLKSSEKILQFWGYHSLQQISEVLVKIDAESVNQQMPHGSLFPKLEPVLVSIQDVVQVMLLEFKLGEDTCIVEPFTDSYRFTLGYLLLWDILLTLCKNATTDLSFQYIEWLRSGAYVKDLLNNLFRLMPTDALHCTESKRKTMLELFSNKPTLSMSDESTSEHLEHLVCWVYAQSLTQLPALIRQWWTDSDPRVAHTVEQVTTMYVSPQLCNSELQDVMEREKSSTHNMKIKVHLTSREVIAIYTVDEARMELIITLPVNYPLGIVQVDCSKQIGGTSQWRNWVMQLTMYLTHQNGSIWNGLSLWKNNLDKKFDGVEECYICFSVLHNATYQLPKLVCQTCRKKFHSTCLYKWFSTSNKSTCPICRNLF